MDVTPPVARDTSGSTVKGDDGANVFLDGDYRMLMTDNMWYQSIPTALFTTMSRETIHTHVISREGTRQKPQHRYLVSCSLTNRRHLSAILSYSLVLVFAWYQRRSADPISDPWTKVTGCEAFCDGMAAAVLVDSRVSFKANWGTFYEDEGSNILSRIDKVKKGQAPPVTVTVASTTSDPPSQAHHIIIPIPRSKSMLLILS
eukprot:9471314-Pyramimonas_sp.AAC.4